MKPFLLGCLTGSVGLVVLVVGLAMWDDRRSYRRAQERRGA